MTAPTPPDIRSVLEDMQWRWTDYKPGEDADMDAEIKQVVDEALQAIREIVEGCAPEYKQAHDFLTIPYAQADKLTKKYVDGIATGYSTGVDLYTDNLHTALGVHKS